ncbi:MAG: aquaporin family protein [Dinghuibacter sp.]|nr:aquaporin family protein [Dinghuibacter sp.]
MNIFLSELMGMAMLILLGNGVVANVVLNKTKGQNSGWIVITFGWAMAVFVGVYVASFSGGHLNPAVTIALAMLEKTPWADAPSYFAGQFCGAFLGSVLVWGAYKQHFDETPDGDTKRHVFCNTPAIRNTFHNLLTETIGTFALVFGVLMLPNTTTDLGKLNALPVALLVLGIGISLGGPTGYAINPARDLGPRIMHALLPIKNKGSNDWNYAWIPVLGPILGAALAASVYNLLQ